MAMEKFRLQQTKTRSWSQSSHINGKPNLRRHLAFETSYAYSVIVNNRPMNH